MRKIKGRLSLHRETLRHLNSGSLARVAGADMEPPFTRKLAPTNGAYSCVCPDSGLCDSVVICEDSIVVCGP